MFEEGNYDVEVPRGSPVISLKVSTNCCQNVLAREWADHTASDVEYYMAIEREFPGLPAKSTG